MGCSDLTRGRLTSCKDAIGGLKSVYFIPDLIPTADITYGLDGQSVTTVANTPAAFKYDLHLGNDLTQNVQSSPENGTTYFEQVLSLTLKKLSAEDNVELRELAYGYPTILVEDNMGNYMFVGLTNGSDVTGGTAVTGAAMGDLNGYTLTFTANEPTYANFYTGDVNTDFTVTLGT